MSRLKHDKLSEMLAAATAAQQAAEQQSRRLEIKFARSDKGHALLRSAKLQADVNGLEAQVSQLQGDCHHKVRVLALGSAMNLALFSDSSNCMIMKQAVFEKICRAIAYSGVQHLDYHVVGYHSDECLPRSYIRSRSASSQA